MSWHTSTRSSPGSGVNQPRWQGTRRRWAAFRRQPIWLQVLGWLATSLLLLWLLPWEDLARWFRGAPRWQQVTAVISLILVGTAAVIVSEPTLDDDVPRTGSTAADPAASEEASGTTGSPTSPSPAAPPTTAPPLYPDRLDRQDADIEREVGGALTLDKWSATVESIVHDGGITVVSITMVNEGDRTRTAHRGDWRLQTPTGRVLDPGFALFDRAGEFETVDVVADGSASGDVLFDTDAEPGRYYVIFKPTANPARGIWGTDLP